MNPLLIDLSGTSCCATNNAIELLYKSIHDDEGIWQPHDSILIQRLVELFSQRGLDRLAHVKQGIIDWQTGVNHNPSSALKPKPNMMAVWNHDELALVKLYLESLPPASWALSDHMMAVDYVVQKYMPLGELATEAEWLATRASLMGKVQANMTKQATLKQADKILAALPSTLAQAVNFFTPSPAAVSALEFGKERAVENVRALTDGVRHKMRGVVMKNLESKLLTGDTAGTSLQSDLFDSFASINRDWRRIAVTEAGECQTQGFIASCKPFAKVKRVEQYDNACSFCNKINGAIAEVVPPNHPNKDGKTQIWVGKNNIGRSASPRKRVGNKLVERSEAELYWLPAGLAHPHCRGCWVSTLDIEEGEDPEFGAWLSDLLT